MIVIRVLILILLVIKVLFLKKKGINTVDGVYLNNKYIHNNTKEHIYKGYKYINYENYDNYDNDSDN